jgi:Kef-type K+ transport system membrane component KefB
MKLGQFYILVGTAFLAPHVSSMVGIGAAAGYMALGLWIGFRQKEAA